MVEISALNVLYEFNKNISKMGLNFCFIHLDDILSNDFIIKKSRFFYRNRYTLKNINDKKEYSISDYKENIGKYYENKNAAIHIFGKYLEILSQDSIKADKFVADYFSLRNDEFIKTYNLEKLTESITLHTKKLLYNSLDNSQKDILNDKTNSTIMILAGPGSGKTKVLSHKFISLLMDKCKVLMLSFSRSAVQEFKDRIYNLMDNIGIKDSVEIYTFHSFGARILESYEDSNEYNRVITEATNALNENKKPLPCPFNVLIIDEFQDMQQNLYDFIKAIYNKMPENKKIIIVGDDDQMIQDFKENKNQINYMKEFQNDFIESKQYNLLNNYRSDKKIIDFANKFKAEFLQDGLKDKDLESLKNINGKVCVSFYKDTTRKIMINNILDSIESNLKPDKQIAVLVLENIAVSMFYGMLINRGINAKIILKDDEFRICYLVEINDFLELLQKEVYFEKAKNEILEKYKDSKNLTILKEVIESFENKYSTKNYKNFFEYIEYLGLESFQENDNKEVIVSTIHKAKGMEFDIVYLVLGEIFFRYYYEEEQRIKYKDLDNRYNRILYVAFTRPKEMLYIHTIHTDMALKIFANADSIEPNYNLDSNKNANEIYIKTTLEDIVLTAYKHQEVIIPELRAGDKVIIKKNEYERYAIYYNNVPDKPVSIFSKDCHNNIEKYEKKGYELNDSHEIMYIVKYKDHLQILCKIGMSVLVDGE